MPNLPEDIVDRIRKLERQVQQLTARMQAAAPTVRAADVVRESGTQEGQEDQEDNAPEGGAPGRGAG